MSTKIKDLAVSQGQLLLFCSSMNILLTFFDENTQIVDKLACLAMELLGLPYLKTVFLVFAALGVHIREPFSARTIQTFFQFNEPRWTI